MLGTIAPSSLRTTVAGVSTLSAAGAAHAAQRHHNAHNTAQTPIIQQEAPQQEAANALPEYQPELHGAAAKVEKASHKFFSFDMGTMMGAMALGKVGGFLTNRKDTKVIGKPLNFVGGGLTKAGDIVGAPRKFLEENTVGNGLEATAKGMQTLVGKVSTKAAGGMDGWVKRAQDTQIWFGAHAERLSGKASEKVGSFLENNQGLSAKLTSLAEGREAKLAKAHAKLTGAHITDDMSRLGKWYAKRGTGQMTEMQEAMKQFDQHVAMHSGEAGTAAHQFKTSINALHEHLGNAANLHDTAKTESLLKASKEQLESLTKLHAESTPEVRATLGRVSTGIEALGKAIEPLEAQVGTIAMLKNPAQAVKNLPASLSKMNLHQGAFNTAIAAGSAFTVTRSLKNFHHDMDSLKGMIGALEGKNPKDISTFHALFGDSKSTTVKAARTYMMKVYSVETLADVGDVALNLVLMRKGGANNMMAMMPLMMGAAMIPAVMHGKNAMTAFGGMDALVKSGQPLGAGAYAQFIQQALPQAKNITADNGLLVALGEHYAAMKATPAQMLQEIESNHVTQVASELQAQLAASGRREGQAAGEPPVLESNKLQAAATPALHAATVAGTAAMMAHGAKPTQARTVVGGHTAKLMNASAHHAPTHAAPLTSAAHTATHHMAHDAMVNAQPSPHIMAGNLAQHHGHVATNDTQVSLQA